ncbi:MAG: dienelactone hydrolase family protein [Kiritimatiellae bacterium]|nr:dienelactone hydrolase family protein [Kiritimatiellia bacterium]
MQKYIRWPVLFALFAIWLFPASDWARAATPLTLVAPADGAALDTLTPAFVVNLQKTDDILAAEISFSTNSGFQGNQLGFIVLDNGESTSMHYGNLKRSTTYYWRARTWHGDDMNNPTYGEYTTVWSFQTGSGAGLPSASTLISPANGANGTSYRYFIDTSWSGSANVLQYAVYLHKQDTESTTYLFTSNSSATLGVVQGIVYYWWIRVRNAFGWGPASAYRYFVIPVWESDQYTQQTPTPGYIPYNPYADADDESAQPSAPVRCNLDDFDGDGRADPAMMDDGGNWYLWFSSNDYARGGPYPLGVAGLPSTGDYDGDGRADPAVMDAGGNWHVWFSNNDYARGGPYALGVAGLPSAGDYDGDNLSDPAVMDSGGNWYFWFSSNDYARDGPYPLGVAGLPSAGDYDGDGRADPAVMNGSSWYFWLSGDSYERRGPYILDADAESYETVQESLAVTSGGNVYNFTVYRPNVYRSFPGVLVVNGLNPQQLASKGYYVVSGEPESTEIAIDVVEAMKAHERCSNKVGATGYSWGGAFVLCLAAQGKNLSATFELAGLLVPENNIDLSVDIPNPVYFVTGENDELAPPDSVREMYDEFLISGQPAEIYIVPGAGHGYSTDAWDDLLNRAAAFFKLYLQ